MNTHTDYFSLFPCQKNNKIIKKDVCCHGLKKKIKNKKVNNFLSSQKKKKNGPTKKPFEEKI